MSNKDKKKIIIIPLGEKREGKLPIFLFRELAGGGGRGVSKKNSNVGAFVPTDSSRIKTAPSGHTARRHFLSPLVCF
jgi:hypothetical protein